MYLEKNLKHLFAYIYKYDTFLKKYVNLQEDEFVSLLKAMSELERIQFVDALTHFTAYMKAAESCRGIQEAQGIWTNLVLILVFGLIEKIMSEENKLCFDYVRDNLDKCTGPAETQKILEEWREQYGANRRVHRFFVTHILESERSQILDTLKGNPYFNKITQAQDPIKKFVDWIINCRGKFVHELGLDGLSESEQTQYVEPDKKGILHSGNAKWYPTVSIDQLVGYVVFGVFRKYNRNNILTTI